MLGFQVRSLEFNILFGMSFSTLSLLVSLMGVIQVSRVGTWSHTSVYTSVSVSVLSLI